MRSSPAGVVGVVRRALPAIVAVVALAGARAVGAGVDADGCQAMARTVLRAASVTKVEVLRGAFPTDVTGDLEVALPSPVCRASGVARSERVSRVGFELWVPLGAAWNGKYLQLGNGGFSGRFPRHELAAYLARGYAVGLTDGGHTSAGYTDARWARGARAAVTDFGHRALKATRDSNGRLLRASTGRAPDRAYFVGCSNGGRDALMAAQRYPRDFDGIVAGAPASDLTSLLELQGRLAQRLRITGTTLSARQLQWLEQAVLRQCAPNESFVLDPRSCRVDVESLACAPGQDDDSCLNAAERELVATIYRGLEPGATGRRYGGPSPGAEAAAGGWMGWILPTGPLPEDVPAGADFARGFYGEFVRAEDGFDLVRLTERDVRAGHARFGAILNAIDPDLGEFARHGGRLIQYHGWNDPGIPASFSLSYYDAVRARLGATDSFHRLFMLPGVLHCGGGPGPDGVDWLAVLEGWVERGEAPEEVVARRRGSGTDEPGATMRVRRYRP